MGKIRFREVKKSVIKIIDNTNLFAEDRARYVKRLQKTVCTEEIVYFLTDELGYSHVEAYQFIVGCAISR